MADQRYRPVLLNVALSKINEKQKVRQNFIPFPSFFFPPTFQYKLHSKVSCRLLPVSKGFSPTWCCHVATQSSHASVNRPLEAAADAAWYIPAAFAFAFPIREKQKNRRWSKNRTLEIAFFVLRDSLWCGQYENLHVTQRFAAAGCLKGNLRKQLAASGLSFAITGKTQTLPSLTQSGQKPGATGACGARG